MMNVLFVLRICPTALNGKNCDYGHPSSNKKQEITVVYKTAHNSLHVFPNLNDMPIGVIKADNTLPPAVLRQFMDMTALNGKNCDYGHPSSNKKQEITVEIIWLKTGMKVNRMKYTSTLLAVSDMEKSKQFYHDVLGMDIVNDFGANVTLNVISSGSDSVASTYA